MADEKFVKTVQSTFSLYGLVLSRKLSISLAKELLNVEQDEREIWLTRIVEQVLTQNLSDPHVTVENLKSAIQEQIRPDTLKNTETVINVIDVFDVPKVKYDLSKKKYVLTTVISDVYPEAEYKSAIFKDRFNLLWYRTLRHELFTPPKLGEKKTDWIELVPIEYLLSESKKGTVYVMGLLTQLTEGQYYLEDTGGTIKVDLQGANFQDGLIMEASIVIASGEYRDGILHVEDLGFPPAESSNNARSDFGNTNTFGGSHNLSLKYSEKLKSHEETNKDGMIVFVSDMWLDDLTTLHKFKTMLEGYSEYPPIAFVLCGRFLSFPTNISSTQKLKEGLKDLTDIIMQYSNIKETSKFIFVPASDDVGAPKILPRSPLPKHLTEYFKKNIPGAIFATNPCRIQYCTKEIVVFREDILSKMCRNTLLFPQTGNIYDHYAKSIICQSHLTPLSLSIIPTYWNYDHALQLYPTPDLIVSADKYEAYETTYSNCHIINPGLFPKNDHSFKVYVPALDLIEHCAIPKDMDDV
ncbi:PREDICTED: DNA polymerase epsilon subunit 2 [Habropoda laboriosa]|uniref:DNA polymerase epsilon subunit 2 n=1 Tax=Habropoda laboriosa TaxID=597456 RepID=UPI00083DFEBC|nr:PREDICTED: DNA polymerase epsilon subunit 2 [Habropoda laboriosa]